MRRAAGMRVANHSANPEVAVEDALAPERQDGPPFTVEGTAFLERAVRIRESRLELEELREIGAAGFLLALDQEAHADRKLAEDRAMRLDRLDPE